LKPPKTAPPLTLTDYAGRRVSLVSMRGKVVFVTFVYTHCPDVCPLIVSNLAAAQRQLGRSAGRVRILAVTVDPRRDTPHAVHAFLAARGALGRIDYLLGSEAELRPVWKAWDIGVSIDTKHPRAGHTALVYGIGASGKMEEALPPNFTPAEVVHDAPLLERG
jgi:protein SCO1/2